MHVETINIAQLIEVLRVIKVDKKNRTETLDFARGKYKYKPSFFQKLKNKLWPTRK